MAAVHIEPEPEPEPEPAPAPPAASGAVHGQGICARVLYDYEVRIVNLFSEANAF